MLGKLVHTLTIHLYAQLSSPNTLAPISIILYRLQQSYKCLRHRYAFTGSAIFSAVVQAKDIAHICCLQVFPPWTHTERESATHSPLVSSVVLHTPTETGGLPCVVGPYVVRCGICRLGRVISLQLCQHVQVRNATGRGCAGVVGHRPARGGLSRLLLRWR